MKDYSASIILNEEITKDIFKLVLRFDEKLPKMKGGQFLHMSVPDGKFLLRRPFCVYDYDDFTVTLIIARVGDGTKVLTQAAVGTVVQVILPIGNGFTLEQKHKRVVLLGGGVGGAPLLPVIKDYPDREYFAFLGFSDKSMIVLDKDFASAANTVISTDNGSFGEKGYVTDVLDRHWNEINPDIVLCCGPTPMIKAAKILCNKHKVSAFMSGEAHMGCGVGACLVCTCKVKGSNKRACVDGPVFKLEDVEL